MKIDSLENQIKIALKYLESDISIVPIRFQQKRVSFKDLRDVMACNQLYIGTILPYLKRYFIYSKIR